MQCSNLLLLAVLYNRLSLVACYAVLVAQMHVDVLYPSSVLLADEHPIALQVAKALLHVINRDLACARLLAVLCCC